MRLATASVILATALLNSAHADGDALVDMLGPREVAVGEAMRGGATGATAIGLNPAGLPLNRELVFEGGYGYRASDQASMIGASACDSTAAYPGCFFYDHIGANVNPDLGGMSAHRTTHVGGSALSYSATPHIMLGATIKYFSTSSDMPGAANSSGLNWDVGTTIRLTELVNLGVSGYNLWGANSAEFPRAFGGGLLARPIPILALSFDARWKAIDGDHSARYGGGAELFLRTSNGQSGYPVRLGALHDSGLGTTYVSGGLGMASMKFGIDVAARRAVSGASETMVIASMRFYGPRLRPGAIAGDEE